MHFRLRPEDAFRSAALNKVEQRKQERLQRSHSIHSSEMEVDSSTPTPNSNAEKISRIEKSLLDLSDVSDQCMQFVFPLLATDPSQARVALVNLLNDKVVKNRELEAIFEDLGFVGGSFPDQPDWGLLGKNLADAKKSLERSLAELRHLGKQKRAGRPFGSRNKVAEHDDDFVTPDKPTKKRRTRNGEEDAGKATKKSKADKPHLDEEAFPQDPEHELEEEPKEPNKAGVISLYTKCQVVECAKKLQEENQTAFIEKEVMTRFKQYFFSSKSERWKTGLLAKWTQSLFISSVTLLRACILPSQSFGILGFRANIGCISFRPGSS